MKQKSFIGLLILSLLVSACSFPSTTEGEAPDKAGVRVWFDAPLPNTVFFPPSPCQIVAHGASPNGIATFELSVNGIPASIPSSDRQSSLVTLTRDCDFSEPGEYALRLRTQDNTGNWSGYAETSLIVSNPETPTATLPETEPPATETPTATHTQPPASQATIELVDVSTGTVYYREDDCGPKAVTVQIRAKDPVGINMVVLFYQVDSMGFESVAMNPTGQDLYQSTLNPESTYGIPTLSDLGESVLQLQAVIQNEAGETSTRTPVFSSVTVVPCGSALPPQLPSPTLTKIIIILPSNLNTLTPTPVVK